MKLYDQIARAFVAVVNSATSNDWSIAGGIGNSCSIDFYTDASELSGPTRTTGSSISNGMFGANPRIGLGTIATIAAAGIEGTRAIGEFSIPIQSAVVANAGIAAYFAILNTNTTSGLVLGNVVLTGTVSTSGGAGDIRFNIVDWETNDQISITSLTFVQPK